MSEDNKIPTADLINLSIDGIEASIRILLAMIELAKRTHELTPEEEAALDVRQALLMAGDHWQVNDP